jgi:putative peptide zinc metalloprotease protein
LAADLGLEAVAVSDSPLASGLWYRVAGLRPRLRSHARLHRHRYRDEVWYLLQDPATGRVQRFTAPARLLITLMDGSRSVSTIWETANRRLGEDAPTQDEIIQLLGQLHAADLLQSDVTPDIAELFARGQRAEHARTRRSWGNPMAVRLPLWDPDRLLDRIAGASRLVWSRWGALLWLLVVLPAVMLIPLHWPDLTHDLSDRVLAMDNLIELLLVFPIIKMAHEMGHATATKAGGGEVHDVGVILLVLLPVPYVEASASIVFRSRLQRAVVGAAGVAVELFIAAIAFYLWLAAEPGFARAVLFNVMAIAGVSTLLFNGNPLLRYDAYYILADLIEIPNLGARSLQYLGYLLERYAFGVREREPPTAKFGEKAWFVGYGLASAVYRVMVTVLIALFIATKFFFIGVLLAMWAVTSMAVLPVVKGLRHLSGSPRLRRHRTRAIGVAGGGVLACAVFMLAVPMPFHTAAEGVVWLPENALVRAGASGFLTEFVADPGSPVHAAQPLIRSSDPALVMQVRMAQARVQELEASYADDAQTDRGKARVTEEKLAQERARLEALQERQSDLLVRAGTDGTFVVPQMADMPGRHFRKGDLLGYVIGATRPIVRVVVPQDAIDRVRMATQRIRVRDIDRLDIVREGRIDRVVPGGDEYLPSRALANEGGGEIATDPRDSRGPKALGRMFQIDIELAPLPAEATRLPTFGQRAYVRFEHQPEPLAAQWYRRLRLLFLSRFNV